MRDLLFHLQHMTQTSLQAQIREKIVSAIVDGQLPEGDRMPSSRQLAHDLKVSRNTVTLAYQSLVDDGFLAGRERSGYFVGRARLEKAKPSLPKPSKNTLAATSSPVEWRSRIAIHPSAQANLVKPENWAKYPYPFIYGQVDAGLFPIAEWRDCSRQAMGRRWMEDWAADHHASDDPMLVEQIRTRLLPRRGVMASDSEILITMGAQHALYLLAALLVTPMTAAAFENPGYPDVRNIFALATRKLVPIPVDRGGLVVDDRLDSCDLLYATPSHQAPTTVTMSEARRLALLEKARERDFVIIEDDYEFETNYVSAPLPALKSLDRDDRVIYVGSFSKTIFPGLRLGYLVGPRTLIEEARALRRLMVRHPPNNSQRTAALFLQFGHHDAMILKLKRAYGERWRIIGEAIEKHLPTLERTPSHGGSGVWLKGATSLDAEALAGAALDHGVMIEPGGIFFAGEARRRNYLRLGFSSIQADRIEDGIKILGRLLRPRGHATTAQGRQRVAALRG